MAAYTIKPLVTATAINTGGRNGHSETTDHSVSVNLSVRKEMGGPGLPEHNDARTSVRGRLCGLFWRCARIRCKPAQEERVGQHRDLRHVGGTARGWGFGIAVRMHVKVPTLPTAEARALVEETHEKICPYSHATRGNIEVALEVEGT